jgi:hypothetical protein
MLTAGDVEFEPRQTKIYPITNSIAIMVAGDNSLQNEIFHSVSVDVNAAIEASPGTWVNVRDVADWYRKYYYEAYLRKSEDAILAPLGLNHEMFITRQKEMSSNLVTQISTELINFEMPEVATIFAGVDSSGFHIYAAHNGKVTCHDSVGFMAIGVGAWHADSHLMFSRHTRFNLFPEALLTVYSAKKRAEVAPGVGKDTDMFVIGPKLGSYLPIGDHVLSELEKIYQSTNRQTERANERARKKAEQYVKKILETTTPKEQAALPKDSGGDKTVDEKAAIPESTEGNSSQGQG